MTALIGMIVITGSKPARDPVLHREWTTFAVQGGGSARLWFSPNGTFTGKFKEPGKSIVRTVTGPYRKTKVPVRLPFLSPKTIGLSLDMDLASAKRMGLSSKDVAKLRNANSPTIPFQRLQYDQTIPVMTDAMTVHFAPAGDSRAIQRFNERVERFNSAARD